MEISTYQVNNVLRVYANQLRRGRLSTISKADNTRSIDLVNISASAKKKSIAEKIAFNTIEKIAQYGTNQDIEKKVFQKLESEYGARLSLTKENSKEGHTDIKFKELDNNGEITKTLSLEDSKNLMDKLKKITEDTLIKNMI